ILFSWLGVKIMLAAHDIRAASYEDLSIAMLGKHLGRWISLLILVMLLGVSSVMLAGAGSIVSEQLKGSYQLGLGITMLLAYLIMNKGLKGIIYANMIVVPVMLAIIFVL